MTQFIKTIEFLYKLTHLTASKKIHILSFHEVVSYINNKLTDILSEENIKFQNLFRVVFSYYNPLINKWGGSPFIYGHILDVELYNIYLEWLKYEEIVHISDFYYNTIPESNISGLFGKRIKKDHIIKVEFSFDLDNTSKICSVQFDLNTSNIISNFRKKSNNLLFNKINNINSIINSLEEIGIIFTEDNTIFEKNPFGILGFVWISLDYNNYNIYQFVPSNSNRPILSGALYWNNYSADDFYTISFIQLILIKELSVWLEAKLIGRVNASATKSAIAAIMSRNMSHNLGSHVLFYLKTIFSDTPNLMQKYIHELEENNGGDFDFTLKVIEGQKGKIDIQEFPSDKITAPFLTGVGRFLSYLQERQDFIATIASDYIPYFGSVSFKDFIYDEINPDLRIDRHGAPDRFRVKNVLLDFIAKSEDYTREDIEVYFKNFDGKDKDHKDLKYLRTIEVDLPGGIMGRQAFFSIFENFIRNSAKHSNNSETHKLSIVIDIEEYKNNSNYYRVRLFDKNKNANNAINIVKKAIIEQYIDDTGNIRPSNKGIKEMRISAAWLRGKSVADIDEEKIEPKILRVLKVDDDGKEVQDGKLDGNICYEFYLLKSKKWVFISDTLNDKLNKKKNLTEKNYEEFVNENSNYKLVLYDETLDEEKKNRIKNLSPTRCASVSQNELKISENDFAWFYENSWFKKEFKKFDLSAKYFIIIDDIVAGKFKDENILTEVLIKKTDYEVIKNIDNLGENLIVFRKHNDTEEEFSKLKENELNKLYTRASFIEGISGHNSTNRLLRNETLDKEWLITMTESALTNVLIIDERIYKLLSGSKIKHFGLTENDIITHTGSVKLLTQFLNENDIDVEDDKIKKALNNLSKAINFELTDNYHIEIKLRSKTLYEVLVSNFKNNVNYNKGKFNKELYAKKNISVYNIERDIKNSLFVIKDIDGTILGSIKNNQGEEKLKCDVEIYEKYDFVVIHEGILDKLYEYTSAKSDDDKQLVVDFLKKQFEAGFKYIIHSGRSKPEFLPKNVAFTQFSSIEAALFDCKYSLTEQLYSARYE